MTAPFENEFYKPKYPSLDLERAIQHMDSFEQFSRFYASDLMDENLLLPEYLYELLIKYQANPHKVAEQIGVSHDYIRKIVNKEKLNPRRDVLLSICVYLKVTFEEAQTLLKYAGVLPLYARRKRDAYIWFALKKQMNLVELNIELEALGFKPLCK